MIREVKTENGLVRGLPAADPRITTFKGIPFAAPPVGENRWRAPQPCENWEGVLEAYQFAPISMQDTPGMGTDVYCKEWHVDPEIPMDEDCLYLNVWTNAKSTDEKLPVFVWYYGGGLQWGYPAEMEFDGERIARRGVIIVTVNYRINVFGFLTHPEITKEAPDAPANFGHLDQQAGLRWVIRNIEAFGGDPKNITIGGQSAGGGSVMTQITSPSNFGSFQKALVMSGVIDTPYGPSDFPFGSSKLADTEKMGENFFEYIGAANLKEARAMDAKYVLSKYSEFRNTKMKWMGTVIDDKFVVGNSAKLYKENKHAQVSIMAGNTGDEFLNTIMASDSTEYEKKVEELFGDKKDTFLAFPEASKKLGDNQYAPVSGIECAVKSLFLTEQENGNTKKNYYYSFNADIPGEDRPGTFHSVDLWFFFETLAKCWRPFQGDNYDLSRKICNYLVNFIKNGDPNGKDNDGTDMPLWDAYTKECPCGIDFRTDGIKVSREETLFKQFLINVMNEK
ncbi:MAG TPA: carboxylesterase family protein [Lachnospiraceae bacterium]|nr:carboxylesterase family protein [Lachnospiraceae bacterium]